MILPLYSIQQVTATRRNKYGVNIVAGHFISSSISHETTEGWNKPKYSLNRWPTDPKILNNCLSFTVLFHICTTGSHFELPCPHTWYLSFFLHEQNFWRIKFTPKKTVNYNKIHSKLPIFCGITAKYTVNCQFFALNL